jgi:acyl-CoA dehydrogenase
MAHMATPDPERISRLVADIETFIRNVIIPYEQDKRRDAHGPSDELVYEMREKARQAGVLTPHILPSGEHLTQRDTAAVLKKTGLSLLGPLACNTMAPDEGNMFLLGKIATPAQKTKYLQPLIEGRIRSAFFMTEPASDGGAGSDPGMMKTTAVLDGNHWVINGRKAFITGYAGAGVGIIMARTGTSESVKATMFLLELPNPAIKLERVLDTIDGSMPGGHSVLTLDNLRVEPDQILGEVDEGFRYAQIRLSPARLSHCMRWHGAVTRAQEVAVEYVCRREAFGKKLIDHEGVGFQLADNMIELKQAELMIDWCADVLDSGSLGTVESSMTKVAVADALFRVADRCIQVMGGTGVTHDTMVEQVFREIRAFRIYDGPTEVHKWSLAKKIKRDQLKGHKS